MKEMKEKTFIGAPTRPRAFAAVGGRGVEEKFCILSTFRKMKEKVSFVSSARWVCKAAGKTEK
jgi:hypothetical protein